VIKYMLACDKGHQFESWFADSAAYDKQVKKKLVACPLCDSTKVEKAIMAPRISKTGLIRRTVMEAPSVTPAPAPSPAPSSRRWCSGAGRIESRTADAGVRSALCHMAESTNAPRTRNS
jgi:hypothetical protein